jgi:ubiquinone/menaquinone biosynthesis C-methylase UbiE
VSVNTNAWNRLRYSFWAPLYDLVGRRFDAHRQASLRLLDPKAGERILIVGAGTGGDLPFVPPGCLVVANDLTPAMLTRARARLRPGLHLVLSDGHELAFRTQSFDAVVLHLILAVIPDPDRCLQEVARVLRSGGRIAVFDKFVRSRRPSAFLRMVNLVANLLFTDVTRRFEDILDRSGSSLVVSHDESALAGGFFRYILLRKQGG